MKKLYLFLCVLAVFFTGCEKKEIGCTPVSPQAEESQITAYAKANDIKAVKHSSGIFYEILDAGAGTTTPALNSRVFITYTGKLLDGTQFDQGTDPSKTGWPLGSLIEGWQIGLPLITKGGRIKLIIPSSLAYGCIGSGAAIPPNSVLYFDINLADVK